MDQPKAETDEKAAKTINSNNWRCDNHIVREEELEAAVQRALLLLPAEIGNIRHVQEGAKRVLEDSAAAQLQLLHTSTALQYLEGQNSDTPLSPCTTFEKFVDMSSGWTEKAEDLIEAVMIDGEEIRVRFKAGVVI